MGLISKKGKLFKKTAKHYLKDNRLLKSYNNFIKFKSVNPHTPYGSSDKSGAPNGVFNRTVPKIRHAHLTSDISIWYLIEGNVIKLYGIFSHEETGTGNPSNINKQKQAAQKFSNQTFEHQMSLQYKRNML